MEIKTLLKNKLEELANVELTNVNCPILFGEIELPECLTDKQEE